MSKASEEYEKIVSIAHTEYGTIKKIVTDYGEHFVPRKYLYAVGVVALVIGIAIGRLSVL